MMFQTYQGIGKHIHVLSVFIRAGNESDGTVQIEGFCEFVRLDFGHNLKNKLQSPKKIFERGWENDAGKLMQKR